MADQPTYDVTPSDEDEHLRRIQARAVAEAKGVRPSEVTVISGGPQFDVIDLMDATKKRPVVEKKPELDPATGEQVSTTPTTPEWERPGASPEFLPERKEGAPRKTEEEKRPWGPGQEEELGLGTRREEDRPGAKPPLPLEEKYTPPEKSREERRAEQRSIKLQDLLLGQEERRPVDPDELRGLQIKTAETKGKPRPAEMMPGAGTKEAVTEVINKYGPSLVRSYGGGVHELGLQWVAALAAGDPLTVVSDIDSIIRARAAEIISERAIETGHIPPTEASIDGLIGNLFRDLTGGERAEKFRDPEKFKAAITREYNEAKEESKRLYEEAQKERVMSGEVLASQIERDWAQKYNHRWEKGPTRIVWDPSAGGFNGTLFRREREDVHRRHILNERGLLPNGPANSGPTAVAEAMKSLSDEEKNSVNAEAMEMGSQDLNWLHGQDTGAIFIDTDPVGNTLRVADLPLPLRIPAAAMMPKSTMRVDWTSRSETPQVFPGNPVEWESPGMWHSIEGAFLDVMAGGNLSYSRERSKIRGEELGEPAVWEPIRKIYKEAKEAEKDEAEGILGTGQIYTKGSIIPFWDPTWGTVAQEIVKDPKLTSDVLKESFRFAKEGVAWDDDLFQKVQQVEHLAGRTGRPRYFSWNMGGLFYDLGVKAGMEGEDLQRFSRAGTTLGWIVEFSNVVDPIAMPMSVVGATGRRIEKGMKAARLNRFDSIANDASKGRMSPDQVIAEMNRVDPVWSSFIESQVRAETGHVPALRAKLQADQRAAAKIQTTVDKLNEATGFQMSPLVLPGTESLTETSRRLTILTRADEIAASGVDSSRAFDLARAESAEEVEKAVKQIDESTVDGDVYAVVDLDDAGEVAEKIYQKRDGQWFETAGIKPMSPTPDEMTEAVRLMREEGKASEEAVEIAMGSRLVQVADEAVPTEKLLGGVLQEGRFGEYAPRVIDEAKVQYVKMLDQTIERLTRNFVAAQNEAREFGKARGAVYKRWEAANQGLEIEIEKGREIDRSFKASQKISDDLTIKAGKIDEELAKIQAEIRQVKGAGKTPSDELSQRGRDALTRREAAVKQLHALASTHSGYSRAWAEHTVDRNFWTDLVWEAEFGMQKLTRRGMGEIGDIPGTETVPWQMVGATKEAAVQPKHGRQRYKDVPRSGYQSIRLAIQKMGRGLYAEANRYKEGLRAAKRLRKEIDPEGLPIDESKMVKRIDAELRKYIKQPKIDALPIAIRNFTRHLRVGQKALKDIPGSTKKFAQALVDASDEPLQTTLYSGLPIDPKGTREQIGVEPMSIERQLELFGMKFYKKPFSNVVVKEVLQNSWDSIKDAYRAGEAGPALLKPGGGSIIVVSHLGDDAFNPIYAANRSYTFIDNGRGMSPETVKKTFIRPGETYKGNLADTDEGSGGFGLAKLTFLFGSKRLSLETYHQGTKTTLSFTPSELMRGEAILKTTPAPPEAHGTRLSIEVPESWSDDGVKRPIKFKEIPSDSDLNWGFSEDIIPILQKNKIIGDVSVYVGKGERGGDGAPRWFGMGSSATLRDEPPNEIIANVNKTHQGQDFPGAVDDPGITLHPQDIEAWTKSHKERIIEHERWAAYQHFLRGRGVNSVLSGTLPRPPEIHPLLLDLANPMLYRRSNLPDEALRNQELMSLRRKELYQWEGFFNQGGALDWVGPMIDERFVLKDVRTGGWTHIDSKASDRMGSAFVDFWKELSPETQAAFQHAAEIAVENLFLVTWTSFERDVIKHYDDMVEWYVSPQPINIPELFLIERLGWWGRDTKKHPRYSRSPGDVVSALYENGLISRWRRDEALETFRQYQKAVMEHGPESGQAESRYETFDEIVRGERAGTFFDEVDLLPSPRPAQKGTSTDLNYPERIMGFWSDLNEKWRQGGYPTNPDALHDEADNLLDTPREGYWWYDRGTEEVVPEEQVEAAVRRLKDNDEDLRGFSKDLAEYFYPPPGPDSKAGQFHGMEGYESLAGVGLRELPSLGRGEKTLKDIPKLTTVKFDWGSADIYMNPERDPYDSGKVTVLIGGLFQFSKTISKGSSGFGFSKIPHDLVINVRSTVKADHKFYPFNKQREDWNANISGNIGELNRFLQMYVQAKEAEKVAENFSNVMPLGKRDESWPQNWQKLETSGDPWASFRAYEDSDDAYKNVRALDIEKERALMEEQREARRLKREAEAQERKEAEVTPDRPAPSMTIGETQGLIEDWKSRQEKAKSSRMEFAFDPREMTMGLFGGASVDTNIPLLHNNTNFDPFDLSKISPQLEARNRLRAEFLSAFPSDLRPRIESELTNFWVQERPGWWVENKNLMGPEGQQSWKDSAWGEDWQDGLHKFDDIGGRIFTPEEFRNETKYVFQVLGAATTKFRKDVARLLSRHYGGLDDLGYASGLSIDIEYAGVHVRVPSNAFFLNPLAFRDMGGTPNRLGDMFAQTLIHEAVHLKYSGHGGGYGDDGSNFVLGQHYLTNQLFAAGYLRPFQDYLIDFVGQNWDVMYLLRERYYGSNPRNTGSALSGEKLPTRGEEAVPDRQRESPGRPVREREGPEGDGPGVEKLGEAHRENEPRESGETAGLIQQNLKKTTRFSGVPIGGTFLNAIRNVTRGVARGNRIIDPVATVDGLEKIWGSSAIEAATRLIDPVSFAREEAEVELTVLRKTLGKTDKPTVGGEAADVLREIIEASKNGETRLSLSPEKEEALNDLDQALRAAWKDSHKEVESIRLVEAVRDAERDLFGTYQEALGVKGVAEQLARGTLSGSPLGELKNLRWHKNRGLVGNAMINAKRRWAQEFDPLNRVGELSDDARYVYRAALNMESQMRAEFFEGAQFVEKKWRSDPAVFSEKMVEYYLEWQTTRKGVPVKGDQNTHSNNGIASFFEECRFYLLSDPATHASIKGNSGKLKLLEEIDNLGAQVTDDIERIRSGEITFEELVLGERATAVEEQVPGEGTVWAPGRQRSIYSANPKLEEAAIEALRRQELDIEDLYQAKFGASSEQVEKFLVETVGDNNPILSSISRAFWPRGEAGADPIDSAKLYKKAYDLLAGPDGSDAAYVWKELAQFTAKIGGKSPDQYSRDLAIITIAVSQGAMLNRVNRLLVKNLLGGLSVDDVRSANRILSGAEGAHRQAEGIEPLGAEGIQRGLEVLTRMGVPKTQGEVVRNSVRKQQKMLISGTDPSGRAAIIAKTVMDDVVSNMNVLIKGVHEQPVRDRNGMFLSGAQGELLRLWKSSIVTGIAFPGNFRHNFYNVAGDFSQTWQALDLSTAARVAGETALQLPDIGRRYAKETLPGRLARKYILEPAETNFQLIPGVPWFSQKMAMANQKMKEVLKSDVILGSVENALFNPYMRKIWDGEDGWLRLPDGRLKSFNSIRTEWRDTGILDTWASEDLMNSFGKSKWSEWYDSFLGTLDTIPGGKLLGKKGLGRAGHALGDWSNDISWMANLVQRRQRANLYMELLRQGYTEKEAAKQALKALYDWKHGANISSLGKGIVFLRFWKLAAGMMLREISSPLVHGTGKPFLRIHQQEVFKETLPGFMDPELLADSEEDEIRAKQAAYFLRPKWLRNRPVWGLRRDEIRMRDAMEWKKRKTEYSMNYLGPMTALDTSELFFSFLGGFIGWSSAYVAPEFHRKWVAPDYERRMLTNSVDLLYGHHGDPLGLMFDEMGLDIDTYGGGEGVVASPAEVDMYRRGHLPWMDVWQKEGDPPGRFWINPGNAFVVRNYFPAVGTEIPQVLNAAWSDNIRMRMAFGRYPEDLARKARESGASEEDDLLHGLLRFIGKYTGTVPGTMVGSGLSGSTVYGTPTNVPDPRLKSTAVSGQEWSRKKAWPKLSKELAREEQDSTFKRPSPETEDESD